ncbi:galactokinase [Zhihengliuella alba]|uniref:Galactokinase n=1 Tax=Zhihengliuella alba TaxID=547018 RepID=A0ABP7DVQ1_9MICC
MTSHPKDSHAEGSHARTSHSSGPSDAADLIDHFRAVFGDDPDGVWAAPGRVNLIGEHTDYNEGFVLPFAIEHTARVALRRTETGELRIAGRQEVAGAGLVRVDLAALRGGPSPRELGSDAAGAAATGAEDAAPEVLGGDLPGWARYVAGVLWSLGREAGAADVGPGYDVVLDSSVPIGAGLSSSAAIECAVGVAVNDLAGLGHGLDELVLIAQRAENDFVGAPTGILDQSASLLSQDGHALFLDCRTRESRGVPLALAEAGLEILAIDTRVSHAHESGGYGQLRDACELGARELGVQALRDVEESELPAARDQLSPEVYARVKHIVTENQRVLDAVRLLDSVDFRAAGETERRELGRLLTDSHASMRDDFGNSCPELDLAVDTAVAAGAYGARMTGGGFGGTAIALVRAADAERIGEAVREAFGRTGYAAPEVFGVRPAAGARRLV